MITEEQMLKIVKVYCELNGKDYKYFAKKITKDAIKNHISVIEYVEKYITLPSNYMDIIQHSI